MEVANLKEKKINPVPGKELWTTPTVSAAHSMVTYSEGSQSYIVCAHQIARLPPTSSGQDRIGSP